ncbi:hypothetical protein Ami103574_12205 [Aminipila butyrica]|uniref:Uncharacterized protein n=1 Tax=Aminipila butyrica TaxID=433296 RepID=A0A858BX74_9FIRM|nr:hypothetical protein [Aminipila butyrica]QIB70012.1 hypothetical protein Ami103574_12205 [Aminipila butyrica]
MSTQILQIQRLIAGPVGAGATLLFDSTVISAGNMTYDNVTGLVSLNEPGTYEVHWWVATQSSVSGVGVGFELFTSQEAVILGNSPAKIGEVVGMGLIKVETAPATVGLRNSGGGMIYDSAAMPVKASLAVIGQENRTETSMTCFAMRQLANLLEQMITAYGSSTWSVFMNTLPSYSGQPIDLYQAPGAAGPWFLRLLDGGGSYQALALGNLNAVYPGEGTVWDPAFTFLPLPEPVPEGCDADAAFGVVSYVPVGTDLSMNMGPNVSASGRVYRNEPGVLVLSDDDGNTPIVVSSLRIARLLTTSDPLSFLSGRSTEKAALPKIEVLPVKG